MRPNSRHPLRLLSAYAGTQVSCGFPEASSSFLAASSSSLSQSALLSQAFSSTAKPVDQSASVLSAEEGFEGAAEAAASDATSATRGPRNLWVEAAKILIGSVILGAAGGVAYVSYGELDASCCASLERVCYAFWLLVAAMHFRGIA